MTSWFLDAPKSCAFGKILKMCEIDSTPWVELNWMKSRTKVTCEDKWLREKDNSLRVKRRCQLVVRLKANKCYQELLSSLSSYINLLNLKASTVDYLFSINRCFWYAILLLKGSRCNYFLRKHIITHPHSDLPQDCLRTSRNHLDYLDPYLFYFTFIENLFHYWDYSLWKITPLPVKDPMGEADIDIPRIRPYCVQLTISLTIVLHGGSYQGFH